MECGSYRTIKLLEHATKVIECVFERSIREKVKIDAMQFGFMPGKELQMKFLVYDPRHFGPKTVRHQCRSVRWTLRPLHKIWRQFGTSAEVSQRQFGTM